MDSSEGCVSKVDFDYPKELRKLHNDYSLAPDKIEIEKKCRLFINYKLLIFMIFLNWYLTFLIKKSISFIMKTCIFI